MRKTPSKPSHPTSEPAPLAELANTALPTVLAHRQQDRGNGDGDDKPEAPRLGRVALRLEDLKGVANSWNQVYSLIRNEAFPQPIRISERIRIWWRDEVEEWLRTRPRAKTPTEPRSIAIRHTGRPRGRPRKAVPQQGSAAPEVDV